MVKGYADLGDLSEDQRIQVAGRYAMEHPGKTIALVTDDIPGKPERYVAKIEEWFPLVKIVDRFPGPVPNTTVIKISRLIFALALALALQFSMPAEGGSIRATARAIKRGICLTVGVATFPVLAPLNYVAQTALVGVCYSRGDWRTAAYIIHPYDWYWLDRF